MKPKTPLRTLAISFMLLLSMGCSFAQNQRIAIVSIEDTTIVHQHVGTTIVGNFTDTLTLDIAVKQHIENQLKKYLSRNYAVSIINLPDSVTSSSKGIYSKWGGLKSEAKSWLTVMKEQYDFVIFVNNTNIPREMNLLVPQNTSGFYTRGRTSAFYTTISFVPYRTSTLQKIEYYELGGKLLTPIKDFNLPEDKRTFTPEMLSTLKDGIIKHLDSRVEYFLVKTYFAAQNLIDEIKASEMKH